MIWLAFFASISYDRLRYPISPDGDEIRSWISTVD